MYSLLVVTSDDSFGELIRHSLEETGRFEVLVTRDDKESLAYLGEKKCPLVFLDFSQDEENILKIGQQIKEETAEAKLVVISARGWDSALFEELAPADFLSKPFYTPDLLEMMDKFLPEPLASGAESNKSAEGDVELLKDKNLAAQNLTRLTQESSAQAALITRNANPWASAGQLPQNAIQELAGTLARTWDDQKENNLVRFIRLDTTSAEHMLYATRIAPDAVLALIFDAETPFGTIRSQVNSMIHSLSGSEEQVQPDKPRKIEENPVSPIRDILSDIPSPNPDLEFSPEEIDDMDESGTAIPLPPMGIPRISRDHSADSPRRYSFIPDEEDVPVDEMDKTIESLAVTQRSRSRRGVSVDEDVTEKRRVPAAGAARKIILEPVSPSVYNLDYACLLIPRLTNHHLTGGLLDRLGVWVPHICVAFGWRLEYISIRPDYLQWIVNVAPSTSPGALMRKMRQHTSVKIFEEFRHLHKENPSGDFWAPGYLIMGGLQPPPTHLIRDFITQTRQRQGISVPVR